MMVTPSPDLFQRLKHLIRHLSLGKKDKYQALGSKCFVLWGPTLYTTSMSRVIYVFQEASTCVPFLQVTHELVFQHLLSVWPPLVVFHQTTFKKRGESFGPEGGQVQLKKVLTIYNFKVEKVKTMTC